MGIDAHSAPTRNPAVWIIGIAAIVALWLPPLPWKITVSELSPSLSNALVSLHIFKATESLQLRWDYFILPVLFIYALVTLCRSRVGWQECGLGHRHFLSALKLLWLPTVTGVLILFGIGFMTASATEPITLSHRFWKRLLPFNALIQQIAIQLFFHRQLIGWYGASRKTAVILALLFVAMHAPNPGLMLGTLFGMYFWARAYQRAPNLYVLAISHAILSAVLMQTMPKWLLPSVSVGHRFVEKGIANHWWGWPFMQ